MSYDGAFVIWVIRACIWTSICLGSLGGYINLRLKANIKILLLALGATLLGNYGLCRLVMWRSLGINLNGRARSVGSGMDGVGIWR